MITAGASVRWATIAAALLAALPATAQPALTGAGQPASSESSDKPSQPPSAPSVASNFANPDPGGIRAALGQYGISASATYIGEALGTVSGGTKRSSIYGGRLDMQLDVDLGTLAGLPGLALHSNAYQIHGNGLSRCCIGNLIVSSGIEAEPATRLYELWLEQTLFGGKAALRAGQLAADTEFIVSQYGALFVNATFGFPTVASANLPSGGPSYPLATPGIRLKLAPAPNLSALLAVFNGDPAGSGGDPQRRNRSGTNFRLRDPALLIGEVAYAYNQSGPGLPGTVKLGGTHHFGRFDDLGTGSDGLSLADPGGGGAPRRGRGSSMVYAVFDQLAYRETGTTDQGLGVFARLAGSPTGRSSPVRFYADGGVTYKGLVPGRATDTAGLAASYVQVSGAARGLDRDVLAFSGSYYPIRSNEVLIEATYQAEVVPGVTLQPDAQYIIRPGAHAPNPRAGGSPIRNAVVVGLRASVHY